MSARDEELGAAEQEHLGPVAPVGDTARSTQTVLETQVEEYAALSREYADRGDARLAALALWAADLRAVQALLWGSGISALDDPTEPILAVSSAIETALTGRDTTGHGSVRSVLQEARNALLTAFDPSVHDQLRALFADAHHLDAVPAPAPGAANQSVGDRLDGRGGEQLVADLLATATDCRALADVLSQAGDEEEARRQRVQADLAGFEAYLVLTSAAGGDATLVTTDLRWALAARRLAGPAGGAEEEAGELEVEAVREAISSVVLPDEEPALRSLLERQAPGQVQG
ncbi:MAG TPA: hypothetical protein VER39_06955 [Nocardioidaceae bacterium]|nr:hypothetical protein [Nocardioidaceae bacterium]